MIGRGGGGWGYGRTELAEAVFQPSDFRLDAIKMADVSLHGVRENVCGFGV